MIVIRPEPLTRARKLAYVVFERRDMERAAAFLEDFGLHRVSGNAELAYFRGVGPEPWLVALRAGTVDRLVGFAFEASSAVDLATIAAATHSTVERLEEPGGGQCVMLVDPAGLEVRLVHGRAVVAPLPVRAIIPPNDPRTKRRVNQAVRTAPEPCPITGFGHIVLQRPAFDATLLWYMRHFGLVPSDVATVADGQPALAFLRFDRGNEPTDHHSLALVAGEVPALLHTSWETLDLDALGQGHNHLRENGWRHHWGIGRHIQGSQLFDYWIDAAGDEWEHYADGDVMDVSVPTNYYPLDRAGLWAWGDDLPSPPPPSEAPPASADEPAASGDDRARAHAVALALTPHPRTWLN